MDPLYTEYDTRPETCAHNNIKFTETDILLQEIPVKSIQRLQSCLSKFPYSEAIPHSAIP